MKERRYSAAEGRQALVTGRFPGEVVMPGPLKERRADPERQLQRSVVTILDAAGVVFFHCGNERASRIERMMLSAEGVKPGVPDLGFPFASGGYGRMAWIELKAAKGSLSPAQREWRDYLKSIGHEWACLRSVEAVVETLVFWRVPKAERIRL